MALLEAIKRFWPSRLRQQVMLTVLALFATTTYLMSWHLANELTQESKRVFERYGVAFSKSLVNQVYYPLLNDDMEGAQRELLAEAAVGQADEIYLYDNEGQLLFKVTGREVSQVGNGEVDPPEVNRVVVDSGGNGLVIWAPIGDQQQTVAWLKVLYVPSFSSTLQQVATLHYLLAGLIITLLATLLTALLLRRTTASIQQASEFAERLNEAQGEVLDLKSNTEELQRLYDSLNRASKKIHDQEQEVQGSWLRLSRAQQVAGLGMWEWDAAEEVLYWSSDMSAVNKTRASNIKEAFTEQVLALVPECDREKVFEKLFEVLNGGDSASFDHDIIREDGEHRAVQHYIDVSRDNDGHVVRVVGIMQDVSGRRVAEEALRNSEEQVRTILDNVLDAIITIDDKGCIQTFNKAAESIFGYESGEVIGKNVSILMPEEAADSHEGYIDAYVSGRSSPSLLNREFVAKRKDGTFLPVEINVSNMKVRGQHLMVGIIRDVTIRRQAEENMRLSEQVFANSVEGIVVADANKNIVRANFSFSNITGYVVNDFAGKGLDLIFKGQADEDSAEKIWQEVERSGQWKGEIQGVRKNGEPYLAWIAVTVTADSDDEVSHYIVVVNDITEIKEAQTRIHHLVNFDSLTNLPNRSLFQDRLAQGVAQAERAKTKLALLRIDLDRFKTFNESMGHGSGDVLLKRVAQRLVSAVRQCDTVARMSGDEYAVMLTNLGTDNDAAHVSRKILSLFEQPFLVDDQEVFVTASVGVSLFPNDAKDAEELVKHAGAAMHHVKDHGRNSYRFYTGDLDSSAFEHLVLENSLRRALEREEFVLFYQPQLDLVTGKVIGVEALIRWQHPDLGMVSPAQFIPLLEETGLILPVGDWVLRTACRQAKEWAEAGYDFVRMAVNLSPRQIGQQGLVEVVGTALEASGLDPHRLDLEITESSLMGDVEQSVKVLSQLQTMEVNISIDDFGTGYSSLSYLTRFPINTLKIDRSFVKDVIEDGDDAALAVAIVTMGHSLKLKVLAEGVETPEQLEFLRENGCDEVQGFLFSKPLPAEEVVELFDREMRSILCVND